MVSRKSRAHYHMGGSAKYIGPSLELQKVSKNFIPNSKLAAVIKVLCTKDSFFLRSELEHEFKLFPTKSL